MEFAGRDVKAVNGYSNEAGQTHPHAAQVFAKPQVLN